jgi:hypothetical protein
MTGWIFPSKRGGMSEHDEPPTGPQRAERAKRQRPAEAVEDDVDTLARLLAHPLEEVLGLVVDRCGAEALDGRSVTVCTRAVHTKRRHRAQLEHRGTHPAGSAVDEHRLARLCVGRPM